MLAETFPSILPLLEQETQFEVMSIYQLAGVTNDNCYVSPFRSPHHSASSVSLIGGGTNPKPGEVSLAHGGVLFLDEMAEYPKRTLDMLRQPIETGEVTISRAASTVTYPACFLLIGAMNPCPCGFLCARDRYCTCTPKQIRAYSNRISGPILDRMDILLKLEAVALESGATEKNESSPQIRERVIVARQAQSKRYGKETTNANVGNEELLRCGKLSEEQQMMFTSWSSKYHWSTRVQMKIIRLARTISDLSGNQNITNEAIWEAVTMRRTQLTQEQKGIVK